MKTTWRRKSNRLAPKNYLGANAYLVTATTENRAPLFRDTDWAEICVGSLDEAGSAEGMEVLAYVFMPDHVHLLLLAADSASLSRFMKRFKQKTAYAFKRQTGQELWQKSYHDHILRREEDLVDVASYIAGNPVRAGLVDDWATYPFMGRSLLAEVPSGDLKVAATSRAALALGDGNAVG